MIQSAPFALPSGPPAQRRLRTLLVDDDPVYGTIVRRLLRSGTWAEVTVDQVTTFDEAIDAAVGAFDVVLLDYHMGNHTGLEILDRWRTRGELTPVIMLTATSEQSVDFAACARGAYDYVDKADLDRNTLERAIRYALSIEHSMRELRQALDREHALLRATRALLQALPDELPQLIIRGATTELGAASAVIHPAGGDISSRSGEPIVTRTPEGATAVLPLVTPDGVKQALSVASDDADFFSDAMLAALSTYAQHAAISLHAAGLQQQFQHAQRLEAVGRLAGGVAHDFNNLLTAILGHADLLLDEPLDPSTLEEVGLIKQAGERATKLTAQLLAFARRQRLTIEPVRLDDVVGGMRDFLSRLVGDDVTLRMSLGCVGEFILADRTQLEQVLMNLAVNARDAMPDGGTLSIASGRVTLTAPRLAQDGTIAPGEYVTLAVSDDGEGMDGETMQRMFEPFFTTKAAGFGTGLGLPTVLGIVQQSGGHIVVRSERGRGTIFTIYLPLRARGRAPAEEAAPPLRSAVSRGRGERVLVVEDQPLVRDLVCRALQSAGYAVMQAQDGLTALEILRTTPRFDVIVSDLVMPRMGGRGLLDALRAESYDVPVLLVSGYAPDDSSAATWPHGVSYLRKPFTPADVRQAVAALLESRC